MKPPIFLDYDGELVGFATLADAEAYAEPIDVENHEFEAFDSLGARLVPECLDRRVRLRAGAADDVAPKRLAEALARALTERGIAPISLELQALVDQFAPFVFRTRRS